MSTIVTRAGKGSALTHNEVDANFTNLNTDKVEKTGTDPVVISVNSASDALRITQTGGGNALVVEDSTNPDSTPFVVNTDGRVITGATQAYTNYLDGFANTARNPTVQFNGTSLSTASSSLTNWANADSPPLLVLAKSKSGTVGTMASTFSVGDVAGAIQFSASDNTNFIPTALIEAQIDGTPGTGDMPGRLIFSTTADGASSPTERVRIGADGITRFGNSSGTDENILQIIPTTGTDVTIRTNRTGTGVSHIPLKLQGGTGSPVEISITGGLSIPRTAVTSPVANDGNVFSGTYTPTLTNVTNVAASTAYQCQYMRVGNVVTVSGRVNIDATTTSTNTILGVSLPIASNFASAQNAGGSFAPSAAALSTSGVVFADTTNDRASFRILIDSAAANDYYFTFTYLVI